MDYSDCEEIDYVNIDDYEESINKKKEENEEIIIKEEIQNDKNILIYKEKFSDVFLKFRINNDLAELIEFNFSDEKIKVFLFLFSKSINELINKKINYFSHYTTINNYNDYLKKDERWIIVGKLDAVVKIKCDINNAINCMACGLNIN